MKNLTKITISLTVLSLFLFSNFFKCAQAQEEMAQPEQTTYKGLVLEIVDEGVDNSYGMPQAFVTYKIRILNKDRKGEEVDIQTPVYEETATYIFNPGNKVLVLRTADINNQIQYYITDYLRVTPMIILALIFSVLVILISKKWGATSILGLIFSFIVIFKFILPRLAVGANPVFVAIVGASIIAPVTFYLSHGLNKKTTVALISTIISLTMTGFLAALFVKLTYLTGYGTEEAFFLQYAKNETINIQGLLLAGIIIGSLGVLDDVTISQASIVFQIKKANKKLSTTEVFQMAMEVGHDHIAGMVNTLVLVYTGATLPLLLLFINSPVSTFEIANSEIIAEEVVRTLVGSIGLVAAVPITTLLATKFYGTELSTKSRSKSK